MKDMSIRSFSILYRLGLLFIATIALSACTQRISDTGIQASVAIEEKQIVSEEQQIGAKQVEEKQTPIIIEEPISKPEPVIRQTQKAAPKKKVVPSKKKNTVQQAPEQELIPPAFTFYDADKEARLLARQEYHAPKPLSHALRTMTYDTWKSIRFKDSHTLWNGEELPFGIQFFPIGSIYEFPVSIHIIDGKNINDIPFSSDMFETNDELSELLHHFIKGFSGFRIVHGEDNSNTASFIGATYLHTTQDEISVLGLIDENIRQSGDGFPRFCEWWIEKPRKNSKSITVYALMDSPYITGAYQFTISAHRYTRIDVVCSLFYRKNYVSNGKIGISPLVGMFLEGNSTSNHVHSADGLLIHSDNQWTFSPLQNPRRLDKIIFKSNKIHGYGLIQRYKEYNLLQKENDYSDNKSYRYVWVEPKNDWGNGYIDLIEIPTNTSINNNIFALYKPDESRIFSPDSPLGSVSYMYCVQWNDKYNTLHPLGRVISTQATLNPDGRLVSFKIQFTGGALSAIQPDSGLSCSIALPEGSSLEYKNLHQCENGAWELSFTATLPKNIGFLQTIIPSGTQLPPLRFSAFIRKGDNLPEPITEIWMYDLRQ